MTEKRLLFLITAYLVIGAGLILLLLHVATRPSPSREQLCQNLVIHVEKESCLSKDNVTEVLTEAFEPGVTTQAEIHAAIGQYRYTISAGGTFETYKLESTWFNQNVPGMFETIHLIKYDENGLFLRITVED